MCKIAKNPRFYTKAADRENNRDKAVFLKNGALSAALPSAYNIIQVLSVLHFPLRVLFCRVFRAKEFLPCPCLF